MNDFHSIRRRRTGADRPARFRTDRIVWLSLRVSLSASLIALAIGAPLGIWLAITRFRGRQVLIVLANALLGLPPVVAGLVLYLLLSRTSALPDCCSRRRP